jgi:hypothetical protein
LIISVKSSGQLASKIADAFGGGTVGARVAGREVGDAGTISAEGVCGMIIFCTKAQASVVLDARKIKQKYLFLFMG